MIKKKNNIELSANVQISCPTATLWQQFVQTVYAHVDPVLASILHATDVINFDKQRNILEVETLKKFILFQDLFLEHKHIYQEFLNKVFGYQVVLVVHFTKIEAPKVMTVNTANSVSVVQSPEKKIETTYQAKSPVRKQFTARGFTKNEKALDVSDGKKWKITRILLENLGGTVREVIKESDEFNA